jgi:hypothetical protein
MMQSGKSIMIVDDEPDITYIMKKALQLNGIIADSFNDPGLAFIFQVRCVRITNPRHKDAKNE